MEHSKLVGIFETLKSHAHPHDILGLHERDATSKVIRLWRPGAQSVHIELFGKITACCCIDRLGLFELIVPLATTALDYRIYHENGSLAHDPYAFLPTIGELDIHLLARGVHYRLYEIMGARLSSQQGIEGVKFAVWAPSAKAVNLVADFNHWNGNLHPMRRIAGSDIWELFVPGLKEGEKYKFELTTQEGFVRLKSDPFALSCEMRPKNASVIASVNHFTWTDESWMEERRKKRGTRIPMLIYEVHLGSWKKKEGGGFLNYRELAPLLALYCHQMGFTHIELLPIAEHPLDESWGYQVTGFFSVTSRHGTPEDFQYFINHLHQCHIGVIVDWVPAHFPLDDFALARFDGTCLFEHEDPRQGFHPHWNTHIFNYGRYEVSNFLVASALFWLDKMHLDGLRVDAVASMLYLDYGRKEGEWIPNRYGGKENLEAIEFIKHLNSVVHQQFPGAITCAEESTSFPGVTKPLEWGGLGFDYKWNMGWMNDTLHYFHKDPLYRHYHHEELTFGLLYAFSEKFILVLSHDEVVHGKGSLLSKMPGDEWQQFANLRLLYGYLICQPGKKCLFMGGELGQKDEWRVHEQLPWHLLDRPLHQGMHRLVKALNYFYQNHPPLWEYDDESRGFEWLDFSDRKNSVISYFRKGDQRQLLCVHNFTPSFFNEYFIRIYDLKQIEELFNSDREEFGGSGKINREITIVRSEIGRAIGCQMVLPPLATMIFEVYFE